MKRIVVFAIAMAAAIASDSASAQFPTSKLSPSLGRLYGVPAPKVNFGSCQAPLPAVQLSPPSLSFGTVASPTVTSPQVVTIKNVGNNILQFFNIDSRGDTDNPDYFPTVANTCGATLAPQQTCQVSIVFNGAASPSDTGPISGSLSVQTNAPTSVVVASLSATQVAQPVPQFDSAPPGGLDFGYVPQGSTSAPLSITIKNVGSAPMPTLSLGTGSSDYTVVSHNCAVVPPGGFCTANVTFSPSFTGPNGSFVSYQYNHPIQGTFFESVSVNGFGLAAGSDIYVSPASVDFGVINVASSWFSGVDVTNSGTLPLIINSYTIPAHFNVEPGSTCPIGGPGLAPGATCNISISADTSAPGFFSSTLTIDNSSTSNPLFGVPIVSQVIPSFTLTPDSYDFGAVFVGSSANVTVSLTNNDPIPADVNIQSQLFTEIAVAAGGPSPCGATLASGATCTFVVTFTPSSPGGYFGPTIALKDAGGNFVLYQYSFIGTGMSAAASAQFSPSFVDFGSVVQGTAPITLTTDFTNVGNQPMNVSGYSVNSPFTVVPQLGFCPGGYPTIAPGESCRLAITFTPPATVSNFFETLTVDGVSVTFGSVDLFAFTTSGPTSTVDFYPGAIDFGNVGVNRISNPQIISFGNTGTAPFSILSPPTVTGPFLLSSTCPSTLNPGDCCALTIRYAPLAPGGPDSGTVNIVTDDASAPNVAIPLAGVGVPPPSIDVVPITLPNTRLGFTTGPVAFTVTNVGVTPITLGGFFFSGASEITTFDPNVEGGDRAPASKARKVVSIAKPVQRGKGAKAGPVLPCSPGMPLAIGDSCFVNFWFKPTGLQSYSGAFTVSYSGGTASPAVFPVLATGVPPTSPDIALSSDVVDFSSVVINTLGQNRLVITSTGTSALEISAITALGGNFTQDNDCLRPLEPGQTCAVNLAFRPNALRDFTGDLVIEYAPQGSFRLVRLLGTGINEPKPRVQLSASSLAFNAQRVGNHSPDQSVLVRNIGTSPLVISGVTAPPGYPFVNGCTTVAPGQSCTIVLRFAPRGAGRQAGTLAITSNDPERPTATIDLAGIGCPVNAPGVGRNIATQCGP